MRVLLNCIDIALLRLRTQIDLARILNRYFKLNLFHDVIQFQYPIRRINCFQEMLGLSNCIHFVLSSKIVGNLCVAVPNGNWNLCVGDGVS